MLGTTVQQRHTNGQSIVLLGSAPLCARRLLAELSGQVVWREILSVHYSVLARLVVVSSSRDPDTGRYYQSRLTKRFSDDETDRALRA